MLLVRFAVGVKVSSLGTVDCLIPTLGSVGSY